MLIIFITSNAIVLQENHVVAGNFACHVAINFEACSCLFHFRPRLRPNHRCMPKP